MKKCFTFILLVLGIMIIAAALPKAQAKAEQSGKVLESKKPDLKPAGAAGVAADKTVSPALYEYNSKGRRDPFATLIIKTEAGKKKGATPIESYEVAEFKLTAILWDASGFYALVSTPDGKNFTLKEGTIIGLHGGKIYKITRDSVIIREVLKDYRGIAMPKDTVLKLHREEEG